MRQWTMSKNNTLAYFNKGLTLIELIVTVALVGIIVLATSGILFGILKAQSKGEVNKEVKQNGDYVLSIMEGAIRNATLVQTGSVNDFTVIDVNNNSTKFTCYTPPNPENIRQSINGAPDTVLTSTAVDVKSCNFTVVPAPPQGPPYVLLYFIIQQHGTAGNTAESATSTYQEIVSLRNYTRK